MLKIRLAEAADLPLYQQHELRLFKESGSEGDFIFTPVEFTEAENAKSPDKTDNFSKAPTEIGWERCWILTDEKEIYGDLKLVHRMGLKTSLHRATLMMGIERSHRKQGWGPRLMKEALDWARAQPSLEWVDLFVFSQNKPALALYQAAGFQELGRVPDLFRVYGQKIEDIHMCLHLRQ